MICLVKGGAVAVGPVGMATPDVLRALYIAGFTSVGEVLHAPDGQECGQIPEGEVSAPVSLAEGYEVWPVTVEPDAPGEGQIVTGHTVTVETDHIRVTPEYGPAPVPSLADAKAAKQAEITAKAQAVLEPLQAEYPDAERQTWDQQAAQAAAYLADSTAYAPLLEAIAGARGMDVQTLAEHIVANKVAWEAGSGHVVGQRLAYQDALDAAATVEEVSAIAVEYSLPAVGI